MTRENKLALVVGFALVLFVGILITDHYASHRAAAKLDDGTPLAASQRQRNSTLIDDRDAHLAATATDETSRSAPPKAHDPVDPPKLADSERAGSNDSSRPIDPDDAAGGARGETVANADEVHRVGRGETLYAIVKSHYGDGALWKKVATYNGVSDPASIREGRQLRLPAIEVLRGGERPAAADTVLVGNPQSEQADRRDQGTTYKVREGDTLSTIARQLLGARSRWKDLYDFNRDVIKDPDDVSPGTVIRIPGRAA